MDKEQKAIARFQEAANMTEQIYGQPLLLCYSGGKDSDVLLHVAQKAGIPFEVQHSLTTVDAPETMKHVYSVLHDLENKGIKCDVDKHIKPDGTRTTMFNLIPKKMIPPLRQVRYCCAELKEGGGRGRFIATGVRWDESVRRKKNRAALEFQGSARKYNIILNDDNDESRRMFETCNLKGKRIVNPLIDWTDEEIWDYCENENICMNPLYGCGYKRIGCIGCPMASVKQREEEFARYPQFKKAYIWAFDKMIERRKEKGLPINVGDGAENDFRNDWSTGEKVFDWWLYGKQREKESQRKKKQEETQNDQTGDPRNGNGV